jgi:heme/copper-type cytochrome/quinol oxidase subunit 2
MALPPSSIGDTKKAGEETTSADKNERQTAQSNETAQISAAIKTISDAQNRQTEQEDSNQKISTVLNVITIILVFLTVFFTYKTYQAITDQVVEMQRAYKPIEDQANASKDSAETAQKALIASERPWLDITNITINDICLDVNGARITVEFDIVNSGHSPALRVNPSTSSTISLDGAPDRRGVFDRPMVTAIDMKKPNVIFPESHPVHRSVTSYVFGGQLKWLRDQKIGLFPVRTVACVDYGFGGNTTYPHQTCYSLTLTQRGTGLLLLTLPDEKNCVQCRIFV